VRICIIRKGYNPRFDKLSAFFENDQRPPPGLDGYLPHTGITQLTMVGLALDFLRAVFFGWDAAKLGFGRRGRLDVVAVPLIWTDRWLPRRMR